MLKGLDMVTNSINFRKITKMYILISILLIAVALASAVFVFREKIVFTMEYLKIDNRVDRHGIDNSIQGMLSTLANSTGDIKDVLLLDKDNNILYSAKNSGIAKNNKLLLQEAKEKKNFFQDVNTPDIYYKVVEPERLLLTKDLYRNSKNIKKEYMNDFFYDVDYNSKKIYFLNYFIDGKNGMKVFVINDIKPVPYAEPLIKTIAVLFMLIFAFYWILVALWVYKDANRRNLNAALWGLLMLITNLVGLLVYTIYKQNNQTCFKCGSLQSKLNTFCSCCGTRMNESCDKCGSIITKNDNYCVRCGIKIDH